MRFCGEDAEDVRDQEIGVGVLGSGACQLRCSWGIGVGDQIGKNDRVTSDMATVLNVSRYRGFNFDC